MEKIIPVVLAVLLSGCASSLPQKTGSILPNPKVVKIQTWEEASPETAATVYGSESAAGTYTFMDFAVGRLYKTRSHILINEVNGKATGSLLGGTRAIKLPPGSHQLRVSYVGDKRFTIRRHSLPEVSLEAGETYVIKFDLDYVNSNDYEINFWVENTRTQDVLAKSKNGTR